MANHTSNMHHMWRRIEEQDSLTERKKNFLDARVYPVPQRAPGRSEVCQGIASWLPRNGRTHDDEGRPVSRCNQEFIEHREADEELWQNAMGDECPSTDPLYRAFREALLGDIVANRLYEEDRLNRLWRRYMRRNAAEHRPTLMAVIRDLKHELRTS
eukprot:evm.model.scf_1268.2 EVM.evm.TU.scf_1268.2   scf_1268:5762-8343(-)